MSSEKDKFEDLSERIRKAEAGGKPELRASSDPVRNAGYDFAGVLLGSIIIGVLLDRFFGTAPWCAVGFVALGFVTGVVGIWRTIQKTQDKE
ncbi:MAG: AtpZ/AtpI family protein [Bdellovibrionales bacterium]